MRLPPLNALRAFEAAARHGGYIDAADELHVTRGAISRHVKTLEEHLGVTLFRRASRGVELTRAGRDLLPALTKAFKVIEEGAARVTDRSELRVICPPALSVRWLLPSLPEFRAAHPDVRIKLTTDFHGDHAFDGTDYDISIGCANPSNQRPSDIRVEPVAPYTLVPACSPGLLESARIRTPEDLVGVNLIREDYPGSDWPDWLKHFRMDHLDLEQGDVFPNFDLAIRAAIMGTGVIMGDLFLCREEFEKGILVQPFPGMSCESSWGWFCVLYPAALLDNPSAVLFLDWVNEIAARDRQAVLTNPPYA
jgi:LysR family glycine cleavage system transcriptional activator